jgi:hypothetical protein
MVGLLRKLLDDGSEEIWDDGELQLYLDEALKCWQVMVFPEEELSWYGCRPSWKLYLLSKAAAFAIFALELSGEGSPVDWALEKYRGARKQFEAHFQRGVDRFGCWG